jgi:hypothetical protein
MRFLWPLALLLRLTISMPARASRHSQPPRIDTVKDPGLTYMDIGGVLLEKD